MAKVVLSECDKYEYNLIKEKLWKSVEELGGFDSYIEKGNTVLLKVNLLMKKKPEDAVTTHPVFVKALADILVDYGVKVIIGDSPGGPFNERMLKGIYEVCGYNDIQNGDSIILNDNYNSFDAKHPEGKILKNITVIDLLNHVDKVISVSKLKTHGMMAFTGAVKNMFGTIPGILKAEYHFKMPEVKDFSEMLVDVCMYSKPVLSFMDGIVGMEGAGPSGGELVDSKVIIASDSPYHLDYVAVKLIGASPDSIPTVKRTIERGIVKSSGEDIEILGKHINEFDIKKFKIPNIENASFLRNRNFGIFKNISDKLLRPRPDFRHEKCIGCGDCMESCPPKVIHMEKRKPFADLNGCIRCFCCQELCPAKAIDIKRPFLMKIITRN